VMNTPRTQGSLLVGVATTALLLLASASANAQDLAPPPVGTPPDPNAPPTPPADDAKREKEEKKDSGRGLEWLYLTADAGFSYMNMTGLSGTLTPTTTTSEGPAFGFGAGIRLVILQLGVHATLNDLSAFNLWQVDGVLGFHIPIGHWEPYFGLHGGYCFVGNLTSGLSGSPDISITGGDAGLQLGLDYYYNHFVSLGLEADASALFLSRPATTLTSAQSALLPPSAASAYQASGDSIGYGVIGALHLGFHL